MLEFAGRWVEIITFAALLMVSEGVLVVQWIRYPESIRDYTLDTSSVKIYGPVVQWIE